MSEESESGSENEGLLPLDEDYISRSRQAIHLALEEDECSDGATSKGRGRPRIKE